MGRGGSWKSRAGSWSPGYKTSRLGDFLNLPPTPTPYPLSVLWLPRELISFLLGAGVLGGQVTRAELLSTVTPGLGLHSAGGGARNTGECVNFCGLRPDLSGPIRPGGGQGCVLLQNNDSATVSWPSDQGNV